jgi:hypothetical protein
MFEHSGNEIFGADALNLAAIIGAGLLLLASITAPATYKPVSQTANTPVETVTVIAPKKIS